jgi:hypothetical protein
MVDLEVVAQLAAVQDVGYTQDPHLSALPDKGMMVAVEMVLTVLVVQAAVAVAPAALAHYKVLVQAA